MTFNRLVKPVPENEISFTLPEIEMFKLRNGLKILFVNKSSLPIVRFNLVVNSGSKVDEQNKKGLSNLFGMMLDEGAGKFNALQLSDEFDALGTSFNIGTSQDSTYVSMQTLKENMEESIELFSLVLTKPKFAEEDFEREKRKILTRLIQVQDEPDEIADNVFEKIIFGIDNPYTNPTIGLEKDINNFTINDVRKFYNNFFQPDNAALIVVGDTNKNELLKILNRDLNDWPKGENINLEYKKAEEQNSKFIVVHKENTVQSEIRAGHLTSKRNEKDFYSKLLLNTILGGQFSSRINMNLREAKGYTYGAFTKFTNYMDDAYFYLSTSVGIENTGNTIKEIIYEINKIQDGVLTEEVDFAKSSIMRRFPSGFETYGQIAANLTGKVIYSLPDGYFNNYLDKIKITTLDDINKAAQKNIFPDKMIYVIVGDKTKIIPQLKELEIKEIEEVNNNGDPV